MKLNRVDTIWCVDTPLVVTHFLDNTIYIWYVHCWLEKNEYNTFYLLFEYRKNCIDLFSNRLCFDKNLKIENFLWFSYLHPMTRFRHTFLSFHLTLLRIVLLIALINYCFQINNNITIQSAPFTPLTHLTCKVAKRVFF